MIKEDQKYVPENICIGKDEIILHLYSAYNQIDFNRDSLYDCIFVVTKKNRTTGDKKKLVFYTQNPDSTYSFFKEFDNIFPFYNPDLNEEHPEFNNDTLQDIFDNCYRNPIPLYSLTISNDSVSIDHRLDIHDYEIMSYTFVFDQEIENWELKQKLLYGPDKLEYLEPKKGVTLSDFSYCWERLYGGE